MNVKLTLAELHDQLLVPTTAIQNGQRSQQVFVVNDKKTAEPSDVVADRAFGENSVISKGLKEGETVVEGFRSGATYNLARRTVDLGAVSVFSLGH